MKQNEPSGLVEEGVVKRIRESRVTAPADFLSRVMQRLPDRPEPTWSERVQICWPSDRRWWTPVLAGAAAAILLGIGSMFWQQSSSALDSIQVTFEMRAPGAKSVELAGSFNNWQRGKVLLHGPDATGNWTATVSLPPGHYEYLFLEDGEIWVTDPLALAHRADGFGNQNAILEL
ncbi:MAG: glycogen-binding domain-containing protein [bacterium]|jgi:hypothetical protein